jgi:hypothetical protein
MSMDEPVKTIRYLAAGGRELAPSEVLPDMSNVAAVEVITEVRLCDLSGFLATVSGTDVDP